MSQIFQTQPPNPHAQVEMDGRVWDSYLHTALFVSLKIDLTTDQASQVSWTINDPEFDYIDRYSLEDGIPQLIARVWVGYGTDLAEPLFKGLLARIDRDQTQTTFVFYDMSYKMRLAKKTGYHKGSDLQIMKLLVERNDLIFDGPTDFPSAPVSAVEQKKSTITDEKTDWELFTRLAKDAGLWTYTRGDTVFAREPKTVDLTPALTLTHGKDFFLVRGNDFSYRLPENQEGRPASVEVRGRGKDGKKVAGKSTANKRGRTALVVKKVHPRPTVAALTRRAEAKKALEREHAFSCRVRSTSAEPVRADVLDAIKIAGSGKLFSGIYLCESVAYDFSSRGLYRSYNLVRDITAG